MFALPRACALSGQNSARAREYHDGLELLKKMLGPVVMTLVGDQRVSDILVRPGWMSATYIGEGRKAATGVDSVDIVGALRVIAPMLGQKVAIESPRVSIGLPELGVRIVGTYEGPYGCRSTLSIRCHRVVKAKLTDFLGIRQEQITVLSEWLLNRQERRGVFVSGVPGAGKTTFLRALLTLIPEDEHIVVVEDIRELQLSQPFVTEHEVTDFYSYRDAMADVRREEPDRVVLQEIIGAEAREVVSAGIAGTPPYATVHAYSISNALDIIKRRALEGGADNAVTEDEIARAFGIGIQMRRSRAGFNVASIQKIEHANGGYKFEAV